MSNATKNKPKANIKKQSWYQQDKKANPRKYRLKNFINTIERREERKLTELERGRIELLLDNNVNGPCHYCQQTMTIKTISCDHTVPISRGGKKDVMNLQFICLSCNMMKGNLTGDEFQVFMDFLRPHPEIYKIVSQRLKMSGIVFTGRFNK